MYKLEQYVHGSISVVITYFLYVIFITIILTMCIVGVWVTKTSIQKKDIVVTFVIIQLSRV